MAYRVTTKWLTVCLHYNEPWEEFLVKAVKPYVDVVQQTGVAERFFFQRSWERGPNISLWFKGSPYVLEHMLKPNLEEHFNHYFESRPSFLTEPQYSANYPDQYKWLPNNSVQYKDYEPELDRLGGRLELLLCEKQFEASSNLILKILKENLRRWNYNEVLSTAIKFHLGLAYSVGMRLEEARYFFSWLAEEWAFQHEHLESGLGKKIPQETIVRSFQKIYDLQKKDILPYLTALWELFKNYRKIEDESFVEWFHINSNTSTELSLALESNRLPCRKDTLVQVPAEYEDQLPMWQFYKEFVHKTSNRLGIHHKNEGYLYFAMAKSLQSTKPIHTYTNAGG